VQSLGTKLESMTAAVTSALAAANHAPAVGHPIRVMVVDDSIVARSLVARWVDAEPDMRTAAALSSGREAVEQIGHCRPDVVVLDVEMPDLDGISALPLLLKKKPDTVVIMASALTRRSAEISLRALSLGAADYVPKPETARGASSAAFRGELIEKIRQLGRRRLPGGKATFGSPAGEELRPPLRLPAHQRASALWHHAETNTQALRPFATSMPRVLLIGSSTGGPQALTTLIKQLGAVSDRAPVLITQHMPPTFTTVLAEHLTRVSGRRVREAEHGEAVVAGRIYIAPGGRHLRVDGSRGRPTIALGDDPPINFCKPAIDPLFSSAATVWGSGSLALILTGMGCDGTRGASDVVAAGGSVIAQDEATSVVWGMPRAAAQAGLCSAVLALPQIAPKVLRLFSGDRS
jgi:two-component system, chemotaxis family, protein-glutamate methylesterase/glutaminase